MRYRVTITSNQDGRLVATCPAFPDCVVEGVSREEVVARATDVVAARISRNVADGLPIPPPDAGDIVEVGVNADTPLARPRLDLVKYAEEALIQRVQEQARDRVGKEWAWRLRIAFGMLGSIMVLLSGYLWYVQERFIPENMHRLFVSELARQTEEVGELARRRVEFAARAADVQARMVGDIERTERAMLERLNEAEAKAAAQRSLVLLAWTRTVQFKFNSSTVPEANVILLKSLAAEMLHAPGLRLRVEGHSDPVYEGEPAPDGGVQMYTERIAEAVRELLVQAGVPPDRIEAVGKGATAPIAGNDTPWGRNLNRRVEISQADGSR